MRFGKGLDKSADSGRGGYGAGLEAKVSGPFLFWEVLQEGITHAKSAKDGKEYKEGVRNEGIKVPSRCLRETLIL